MPTLHRIDFNGYAEISKTRLGESHLQNACDQK